MRIRRAWLVAAALLLLVPSFARADEYGTTQGLLVNGAVATTLGATALIIGGALYGNAQSNWSRPGGCVGSCTDGSGIEEGLGIGLMAAGAVHLAVGLPLLIPGAVRKARRPVNVSFAAAPTRTGATTSLTLRF
jgi:hypothetical protein